MGKNDKARQGKARQGRAGRSGKDPDKEKRKNNPGLSQAPALTIYNYALCALVHSAILERNWLALACQLNLAA